MRAITTIYTVLFFFGIYFLMMFIILYLRNKKALYSYPETKDFPGITFLVPAFNEQDTIQGTIQALLDLDYPKEKKEIIIINDGSKDKTADMVRKFTRENENVHLLDKKNSGKADSLNRALKLVKTELFAVTDADSYPEKDSIKKMVGYFQQPDVAAVTSRVLVKNKGNFLENFQDFDYVVIAWTRKLLDYVDSVYVTNGPLSIYKTSPVKRLGGFDPSNLTEDIELTWNLLSNGYKTRMSYSTKVYTTVPSTFKNWINQRIRWNLGGLQTIHKYRSFALRKNLFGWFVITYVSLSFFLALLGVMLLLRFAWIKASPYVLSTPYFFQGYNPFRYFFEINFTLTILLILALLFFTLSLMYYKFATQDASLKRKDIFTIIIYAFVYRPLYLIPLVMSIFKLIKRDIRWYTK